MLFGNKKETKTDTPITRVSLKKKQYSAKEVRHKLYTQ